MKIRCINDVGEFKKNNWYYVNEDNTESCYVYTDLSIGDLGYRFYYYHYFKDIMEKENDGYNFSKFRIFDYYFDNIKEIRKRKLKKIKEKYGN